MAVATSDFSIPVDAVVVISDILLKSDGIVYVLTYEDKSFEINENSLKTITGVDMINDVESRKGIFDEITTVIVIILTLFVFIAKVYHDNIL